MDDSSGSSLLTNTTENKLFMFLQKQRHFGVFFSIINVHGLTQIYSNFKTALTAFILFSGLDGEKVMLQFDQISKLRSKDFDKKDFLKLYLDNTGFNYSYEER